MSNEQLDSIAETLSIVYKKRGYILIDDVQSKLDEVGASLVETTQLIRLLEERGCKVSNQGDDGDDLSFYDGSYESIPPRSVVKFTAFYQKENKAGIPNLPYHLENYGEGLLFYAYLRLELGLSKTASTQVITTLQETYNMFLPEGEDKVIFDIDSAAYIQTVMDTIHNRKIYKKIRATHKGALGTYQMFLIQNKHRVIAACEAKLSGKV